jgi:hypothetical protein
MQRLLRRAAELDHRKMPTCRPVADVEVYAKSRSTTDEDARRGTGRSPGPAGAGLESGSTARWSLAEVDFVRSPRGQGLVRTISVVPPTPDLLLEVGRR